MSIADISLFSALLAGALSFRDLEGPIFGLACLNWDNQEELDKVDRSFKQDRFLPTGHTLDVEEEETTDPDTDELEKMSGMSQCPKS